MKLTDKQQEAVILAYQENYYNWPRGTTLAELADTIGISKQSYMERLHRGEEKIIKNYVEDWEEYEG